MAEQVDVPGLGKMPSKYVTVGLAGAAAVVGYSWWRSRSNAAVAAGPTTIDPDLVPDTDRTPPTIVDSNQSVDATDSTAIRNNSDWTQRATEYLVGLNYDPQTVASTLGKWLAHQPLTATEASLINTARAAFGNPPEGGPWSVTSTATGTTPPSVAGVRQVSVTKTSLTVGWTPPSSTDAVDRYAVHLTGGGITRDATAPKGSTSVSFSGLRPVNTYTLYVYAVNAQGTKSAAISTRITTAR